MVLFATVMLFGVFIASLAQVLLKKSAQQEHESGIREYLNWMVILGYAMMFLATLCSVFAYRVVPISLAMVLDATGYIFVTIFGFVFFKERVTGRRFLALVLIISGILVYALLGQEI